MCMLNSNDVGTGIHGTGIVREVVKFQIHCILKLKQ